MRVGPVVGLQVGPAVGPVEASSDLLAGVTRDATSNVYAPSAEGEWSDFLSANAATLSAWAAPTSLYTCQESASPLDDKMTAGIDLAISGSGDAYQQAITGWTRTGCTLTDGTVGGWRSLAASLPDISSASCLLLAFVRMPAAIPAASRNMMMLGAVTVAAVRMNITTGFIACVSGGTVATGASNRAGAGVIPVVLRVNRTANTQGGFTDTEKLEPAIAAVTGKAVHLGSNGATGNFGYVYAARWDGASAERSNAEVKALLQALGWTITWSP